MPFAVYVLVSLVYSLTIFPPRQTNTKAELSACFLPLVADNNDSIVIQESKQISRYYGTMRDKRGHSLGSDRSVFTIFSTMGGEKGVKFGRELGVGGGIGGAGCWAGTFERLSGPVVTQLAWTIDPAWLPAVLILIAYTIVPLCLHGLFVHPPICTSSCWKCSTIRSQMNRCHLRAVHEPSLLSVDWKPAAWFHDSLLIGHTQTRQCHYHHHNACYRKLLRLFPVVGRSSKYRGGKEMGRNRTGLSAVILWRNVAHMSR